MILDITYYFLVTVISYDNKLSSRQSVCSFTELVPMETTLVSRITQLSKHVSTLSIVKGTLDEITSENVMINA